MPRRSSRSPVWRRRSSIGGGVVAELAQHRVGVLAERRRRAGVAGGRVGEDERLAHQAQPARPRDGRTRGPCPWCRTAGSSMNSISVCTGAAGMSCAASTSSQSIARLLGEALLQQRQQASRLSQAQQPARRSAGRRRRCSHARAPSQSFTQKAWLPHARKNHSPSPRLVEPVGRVLAQTMACPGSRRRCRTAGPARACSSDVSTRWPAPGALAHEERGEDRLRGERRRVVVVGRDAEILRRARRSPAAP